MDTVSGIDRSDNRQFGQSQKKVDRAADCQRQSERIQLRGLCAIGITSPAEPHFAVPETALFPAPISSAAISEREKMTIEL